MVRGVISGKEYSEEDIFDLGQYPRMKEEPLLNEDDCLVVPVRNKAAPHYRRVSNSSFGTRLGRSENDPTHNDCVNYIVDEICNKSAESVSFSTYVFADDKSYEEQVIFQTLADSNYCWFKESEAKVAFHDETYIQPDIAGRDINRFFPGSVYPNVIIEVIRTHHPEFETFQKLFELSKTNHHVYFYFIQEGKRTSKLNHLKNMGGQVTVRVSHYLIGGTLYKNGEPCLSKRDNETFEHWYQYLENSYFKKGKEAA